MRAVDTNVLIYAEMTTSQHHVAARDLLRELAEDARPWAIPWPCVSELLTGDRDFARFPSLRVSHPF